MDQDRKDQVIQAYRVIGERFASVALDGLYTDYYERPVIHSLLGDVQGQRVLDAACGPGSNSSWLIDQGATVCAFDISATMVELTKKQVGSRGDVRQADLNEPLDFIKDHSFDKILCALALDYIKDWDRLFSDFHRVLVKKGLVVFSIHHPFFLDLKIESDIEDNYFSIQQVEEDWLVFGLKIPSYRRPLGEISASLWNTGFYIEQIVEPKPTKECEKAFPEVYEKLSKHPVFLCVSARKRE